MGAVRGGYMARHAPVRVRVLRNVTPSETALTRDYTDILRCRGRPLFLLPLPSTCGIFRRLQLYLACAPSHKRLDGDAPGCGVGYVQSIGPFCLWAPPPARSGILSFYLGKQLDVKCACSYARTFYSVEALLRSGSHPFNEARRGQEMWSCPSSSGLGKIDSSRFWTFSRPTSLHFCIHGYLLRAITTPLLHVTKPWAHR